MSDAVQPSAKYNKKVNWIAHTIVTLLILVLMVGLLMAMFGSKPEAQRWGGSREAPSVAVDIADLQVTDFPVWIDSYGTAQPLTQTALVSDVNGRVLRVSDNIRAGKSFKANEVLVQLDDRDLKVEVEIAAAAAADAEFRYLQEVAEAEIAEQQWNKRPASDAARLLALRKPQVAAALAELKAAEARLARAQLNLERTQIRAPFDGRVLTQMVDVGQVVSPSQSIAEIYSTEAVEVRLPVKIGDLAHLNIDEEQLNIDALPRVSLIGELGSTTYEWTGKIVRSEGAFDPATRMLYLVAQLDDPFMNTSERPAIRVGQFLRAKVEGNTLSDVFVIPRRAVSQDNKVSVADEGFLKKRQITPLWTDANSVVVSATEQPSGQFYTQNNSPIDGARVSLKPTDKLILTPTANLPDGTRVKPLISEEEDNTESQRLISNTEGGSAAAASVSSDASGSAQ
ncbi:efflux RND transporter periplasmic adaptor subunit [Glaciecola sp. XM2]|uniref:efflux RND transporter periplasmic adaptor subunit n=1 Tax=Glaciecola sp. XM2 TaxID=1914931 RepID=UPI001BDDD781|nr:efflux RND transporter periplasmic adaptor subunit [Glaciecola sp. XM2]MBT1449763.1 efflux RND transporter periplasmic adaptor subunit [Glaciecola sp. XM2]